MKPFEQFVYGALLSALSSRTARDDTTMRVEAEVCVSPVSGKEITGLTFYASGKAVRITVTEV